MTDKASNRAAFPQVAAMVDELREVFGAGVKLVWAEENGREIGQRGADGVQPTIQKNNRQREDSK